MTVLRRIARPMIAAIFVSGGADALRNPAPLVPAADGVAQPAAKPIPGLPDQDPETLVRINGAVQVVAGTMLAFNRLPRLSALALAATIVPTTAAGHRFWEEEEPEQRRQQQVHFLKNTSILGGLLLAAADTEGKPGIGWRTRHTAEHAEAAVERTARSARRAAKAAKREAKLGAKAARAALPV